MSEKKKSAVAVLELLDHWNYFKTMVELLRERYDVCLILGEAFAKNLRENFNFEAQSHPTLQLSSFDVPRMNAFLREHNVEKMFVNTIQGFEFAFAFSRYQPPAPFYVTVHSFDLWLGRRPLVAPRAEGDLFSQVNRVYAFCCGEILRHSAGVISTDKSVRDSAQEFLPGKNVYFMPPTVNYRKLSSNGAAGSSDGLVFTIPASVDGGRRDYLAAVRSFSQLASKYDTIKLVLLGRPVGDYGREVVKSCRALNEKLGREVFECFDGYLHQDVFEDRLKRSNFFIVPVNNLHIFGKYKGSGAIHDAMINGRPILIPKDMYFSEAYWRQFGDGFVAYGDLQATLEEVITMPEARRRILSEAAVENANYFHVDNQIDILCSQFGDV